jgi:predicted  nucleic acid-binding Zn-ribbon protein
VLTHEGAAALAAAGTPVTTVSVGARAAAGHTLHSDLQHLIQLQETDLAAERIRRRIADIPAAIAALDDRLTTQSGAAAAVKSRIDVSQTARREIEKDLAAVQGRLSKYKDQLMEVKTNKEYQAMLHEIQTAEQIVREHEDRLLDRMEEQETLSAELKATGAALTTAQGEVTSEKRRIEAERATLEAALQRHTAERTAVAARISPPALALFQQLSEHRKGIALSEARAGSCTQCHVRMRPQIFNEVRRMDTLIQCDSCSRILYYVPVPAETQAPQ